MISRGERSRPPQNHFRNDFKGGEVQPPEGWGDNIIYKYVCIKHDFICVSIRVYLYVFTYKLVYIYICV